MKYTLSETETKIVNGHTLHRVVYTEEWRKENARIIPNAPGGWIESEDNLSQDDRCTVLEDACVFEEARVLENAMICGRAIVKGKAIISHTAVVFGSDLTIAGDTYITQGYTCGRTKIAINSTYDWFVHQYFHQLTLQALKKHIRVKQIAKDHEAEYLKED